MGKNIRFDVDSDKEFEEFETRLKGLAMAGEIPYSIAEKEIDELSSECEGLALSPELEEKYLASMQKAYEDSAIEKVRKRLHGEVKVFGRHLQYIRREAGITAARIAERLGKTAEFVEKLESAQQSPLQLAKETVSDLMEIFRVNLKELAAAIQMSLEAPPMAQGVHARADTNIEEKERLEDLSIAMEDLISVASKKERKELSVPREFLEGIKSELKHRGRTDLI